MIDLFDTLSSPVMDLMYYGFLSGAFCLAHEREHIYFKDGKRRIESYDCARDVSRVCECMCVIANLPL